MLRATPTLLTAALLIAPTVDAQTPMVLDASCTATVGNRTAVVGTDGTFWVPNVPVLRIEQIGATAQRFRVRATCLRDGEMVTGQSGFFTLEPGRTRLVAEVFPSALAPVPVFLQLTAAQTTVDYQENVQLTATAFYADGTTRDVTRFGDGTNYVSANPDVVTVSADGVVTGHNRRSTPLRGLVAAINEGSVGAITLTAVGPIDDLDADGLPDGYEELYGLDKTTPDADADPDGDGLTNLEEFQLGTLPTAPDTDLDQLADGMDRQPLRPDEQPPTVTVTAPADGATVAAGSAVVVAAEADDDEGVATVELFADGSLLARLSAPPYRAGFTAPAESGTLLLEALAADRSGNRAAAAATVTVLGDPLTTVTGLVVDGAGEPVAGASVVLNLGPTAVTDAGGGFVIPGVASLRGEVVANASAVVDGAELRGRSEPAAPVGGGVTELGTVVVRPRSSLFPGRIHPLPGSTPRGLAIADLDGDGHLDVAVTDDATDRVGILFGTGDGRLEAGPAPAVGAAPAAVAAADFDGDGILDLATADRLGGTVSVLLGLGGGFAAPAAYPVGSGPQAIVAADFDGDGIPDLATANGNGGDLAVLTGTGDGGFLPAVSHPVGAGPFSLTAADLDLDGDLDLVTTLFFDGAVVALENLGAGNGGGGFGPPEIVHFTARPTETAATDVNLDGAPDLLVGSRSSTTFDVLLGDGAGGFVYGGETPFVGVGPHAVTVGELDGTGPAEVVAVNASVARGFLLAGAEQGGYLEGGRTALGLGVRAVDLGDFDEDGTADLLAALPAGAAIFFGTGAGDFEDATVLPTGVRPDQPVIADLDGDGAGDLAVSNRGRTAEQSSTSVYLGTGGGGLAAPRELPVGPQPNSLRVLDANLDGLPDLLTPDGDGAALSLLLGLGDGDFQPASSLPVGSGPFELTTTDLDLDGVADLVVSNQRGDDLSVLLGRGDGGFEPELRHTLVAPTFLTAGDLDDDGIPDLAVLADFDNDLVLLRGVGDGTFAPLGTLPSGDLFPFAVAAADLDLDGDLDLVTGNLFGAEGVELHRGRGDGTFEPRVPVPGGREIRDLAVADLDLDGRPELVALSGSPRRLLVFPGRTDGNLGPPRSYTVGSASGRLAVGDLDGDGRPDMAVADGRVDTVWILLQR